MSIKLIYFTAGVDATPTEDAEIAVLEALTIADYNLEVRNGSIVHDTEACDMCAGTIPTAYNAKPVYGDIDADKPLLFEVWPKTSALDVSEVDTQQLRALSITGTISVIVSADVTATDVTYESDDEAVATVSAGGLITPIGAGTCIITATYEYATGKTLTAECAVTVQS